MKATRALLTVLLVFACMIISPVSAQEDQTKVRPENETTTDNSVVLRSLKIHVVLSEYDGKEKVSSLPYDLPLSVEQNKGAAGASAPRNSIRVGVRVPVSAKSGTDSSVNYVDVGTDIDCGLNGLRDDQFMLWLTIDRSSLYVTEYKDGRNQGKDWVPGDPVPTSQPLLRHFKANLTAALRDGQSQESTVATDPLTGHVLKVDVGLGVVK